MLGTLGLEEASGAMSGAIKKAPSGGAVRRVLVRRGARKASTTKGGFLGELLAGLAGPLILNTLGIGSGASRAGKELMLPGSVGYGKKKRRRHGGL